MLVDEDQLALDGVEVAPEAAEARSGGWRGRPAAGHGFVDRLGRVLRTLQRAALLDKLHHLLVSEAVIGLQGEAEDLPEQHSEGPDIALRGVPVYSRCTDC